MQDIFMLHGNEFSTEHLAQQDHYSWTEKAVFSHARVDILVLCDVNRPT